MQVYLFQKHLFLQKIVHGITMKTTSAEHGQTMFCACSFHGNSMNNLLSYCGLIDAKIRSSDKDLPVQPSYIYEMEMGI